MLERAIRLPTLSVQLEVDAETFGAATLDQIQRRPILFSYLSTPGCSDPSLMPTLTLLILIILARWPGFLVGVLRSLERSREHLLAQLQPFFFVVRCCKALQVWGSVIILHFLIICLGTSSSQGMLKSALWAGLMLRFRRKRHDFLHLVKKSLRYERTTISTATSEARSLEFDALVSCVGEAVVSRTLVRASLVLGVFLLPMLVLPVVIVVGFDCFRKLRHNLLVLLEALKRPLVLLGVLHVVEEFGDGGAGFCILQIRLSHHCLEHHRPGDLRIVLLLPSDHCLADLLTEHGEPFVTRHCERFLAPVKDRKQFSYRREHISVHQMAFGVNHHSASTHPRVIHVF